MRAPAYFSAALLLAFPPVCTHSLSAQAGSSTARQRAALQKACNSGVLSADECQSRLAALNGGASSASPAQAAGAGGQGSYSGGPALSGRQYHEPRGRFTLTVPQGWNQADENGSVKFTSGDTWVIFETTSSSANALQVAQREADSMKSMVGNWKVYNQGQFTTKSNHPAGGITAGCTVPTRAGDTQRVMIFASQSAGNNNYVKMTSSSKDGDRATIDTLMGMFESVRFGNE